LANKKGGEERKGEDSVSTSREELREEDKKTLLWVKGGPGLQKGE